MQTINTAVIGIGNIGSAHVKCLLEGRVPNLRLTAVCDSDCRKTAAFSSLHPNILTFTDYQALLRSGCASAVIIAVPHPMHAEIAQAALSAGYHVQLEKPVDVSVSKALQLNSAAAKCDRVFSIMFNQRTNPLFQRARQIVRSGDLGDLRRTIWIVTNWYRTQHYYDSGEWRATWRGEGGGVLLNQAPHNLDIWQWICGMPVSVRASCEYGKYHRIEVEDEATIFTRFENGATGVFLTSTGEFPGTNRLEIVGTRGKIVLENRTLKWWRSDTDVNDVIQNSNISSPELPLQRFELRQDTPDRAHQGILQNFANAITQGEPLIAPGEEGIHELMLSNAAYLSSAQGGAPVSLPVDADAFDAFLSARVKGSSLHCTADGEYAASDYQKRWQVTW